MRIAGTLCNNCNKLVRPELNSTKEKETWFCSECESELQIASTIRTICSECKHKINTVKDLYPRNDTDFMPVLITVCCDAEPKPLQGTEKCIPCGNETHCYGKLGECNCKCSSEELQLTNTISKEGNCSCEKHQDHKDCTKKCSEWELISDS